ncbi:histidinol-phosphate phosphatase family protein [Desulfovibrio sp. X2]|uniref:D-glycero-beta-D-manno-heptose 1,7-bisphosphate 7-phosphatase n=1 Tax=Desulfovibrio sp. X2 TaxID=941449 RepID=UPI000358C8B7|nr:D-glycero-beta-D-manno-heptose 1,7-bisphosphate 7-phosphatase [Desulfovibrio sp. X2]EPR42420.1 histidinol-phosphate phosphatase family protein [Desulfovibrio sp. X2]
MRLCRAAFLDRDGTIIADKHYLSDPAGVDLLPGAAEGLLAMQEMGLVLVVVSNQSGVGRGYFREEDAHAVNARMSLLLAEQGVRLGGIYFCPHAPEDGCDCRKPGTALLERAAADLELDLRESFFVGDKPEDIEAGRAAGCRSSILVRTGKGRRAEQDGKARADVVVDDLRGAAAFMAACREPHGRPEGDEPD